MDFVHGLGHSRNQLYASQTDGLSHPGVKHAGFDAGMQSTSQEFGTLPAQPTVVDKSTELLARIKACCSNLFEWRRHRS